MLKQMMASKAAQLIAACVCPAALTVAVPDVRKAVHKATAPKAIAKPKTRVKQQPRAIAKPKTRVRAAPLIDAPPAVELASAAMAVPCAPQIAAFSPEQLPGLSPLQQLPESSALTVINTPNLNNPPPVLINGVPEVGTWVQMLVGFGVVGGVTRVAVRKNAEKQQQSADGLPAAHLS